MMAALVCMDAASGKINLNPARALEFLGQAEFALLRPYSVIERG